MVEERDAGGILVVVQGVGDTDAELCPPQYLGYGILVTGTHLPALVGESPAGNPVGCRLLRVCATERGRSPQYHLGTCDPAQV
jgi:hypothetical protein